MKAANCLGAIDVFNLLNMGNGGDSYVPLGARVIKTLLHWVCTLSRFFMLVV